MRFVRSGTLPAASWSPLRILPLGYIGYEEDTGKAKMGDGKTPWASLPYVGAEASKPEVVGSMGTLPRLLVASAQVQLEASGRAQFMYLDADQDMTVKRIRMYVGGTAAAGTTVGKFGLYRVAANGDLTLGSKSANSTTLANTNWSDAERALLADVPVTKGERLAAAVLFVGTTMPALMGAYVQWGEVNDLSPRLVASLDGINDLPASIPAASLGGTGRTYGARLLSS